ncbi:hypothetical protein HK414_00630 [Ramlibacter terrae]|uniref:LysR substrate-binding domain-containing protein n=1 Tax=Ramlibacter terrae TaxID=2732511 RepID=A0ABX6P1V7_9BURK|nr:hypothetical protein HK414_00630 [Ramlibacter terrae]
MRGSDLLTVMTSDSLQTPAAKGLVRLPAPATPRVLQIGLFWRRNAYFSGLMKQCRQQLTRAFAQRGAASR